MRAVSPGTGGSGCGWSDMGGLRAGNLPNAAAPHQAADFANGIRPFSGQRAAFPPSSWSTNSSGPMAGSSTSAPRLCDPEAARSGFGRESRLVALAQLVFLDFAHGIAGQAVSWNDPLWQLVLGKLGTETAQHFLLVETSAWLGCHDSDH